MRGPGPGHAHRAHRDCTSTRCGVWRRHAAAADHGIGNLHCSGDCLTSGAMPSCRYWRWLTEGCMLREPCEGLMLDDIGDAGQSMTAIPTVRVALHSHRRVLVQWANGLGVRDHGTTYQRMEGNCRAGGQVHRRKLTQPKGIMYSYTTQPCQAWCGPEVTPRCHLALRRQATGSGGIGASLHHCTLSHLTVHATGQVLECLHSSPLPAHWARENHHSNVTALSS